MADKQSVWKLDPEHSLAEFSVRHMMIATVRGQFRELTGTIYEDEDNPDGSRVEAKIMAASIDTRVGQRDQHLRSADFLDAERHPAIEFRSRRVEGARKKPGDNFRIAGDLTIRGTTREVTLDVTFEGLQNDPWGGKRAGFSATTTIDRRQWGLNWNQALEAGGVLVGNDVKIIIEAEAVQAKEAREAAA